MDREISGWGVRALFNKGMDLAQRMARWSVKELAETSSRPNTLDETSLSYDEVNWINHGFHARRDKILRECYEARLTHLMMMMKNWLKDKASKSEENGGTDVQISMAELIDLSEQIEMTEKILSVGELTRMYSKKLDKLIRFFHNMPHSARYTTVSGKLICNWCGVGWGAIHKSDCAIEKLLDETHDLNE